MIEENLKGNLGVTRHNQGMQYATAPLGMDDAFTTILQWLHSRIPFTRGAPRPDDKLYKWTKATGYPNVTQEES
jgi:hypothetical protein